MKGLFLIAWRDLKQMIRAPMFYVISAFCAIIWFINFRTSITRFFQATQYSQMQQGGGGQSVHATVFLEHISITNLILLFAVPAITMRLISEEKKTRTFDLLLTSPISSWQIALGKFLAGLGAVTVILLFSTLYPIATSLLTTVTWSTLFANYVGLFLIAGVYVAAGLFASSLTESAMLSVFMGVIFNLMFWLVGQLTMGSEVEWIAALKDYVSAGQQLMTFMQGTIRTSNLIFFSTAIAFFVFLSERVVESSRWR